MRAGKRSPRRSFTVEVKSGERGGTIIPSRVAALAKPTPQLFLPVKPETPQAAEKRRILPNLIVREPEPVAEAIESPRKRGRPRKVRPASADPVVIAQEAPSAAALAALVPLASPARSAPRKPVLKPGKPLPAGERWKRRLGRWSR